MNTSPSESNLDHGLNELLAAWTHRDDLRRGGAPIAELASANERLFNSRLAARSAARSTPRITAHAA